MCPIGQVSLVAFPYWGSSGIIVANGIRFWLLSYSYSKSNGGAQGPEEPNILRTLLGTDISPFCVNPNRGGYIPD